MTCRCEEELCPNWSGDGGVCPCALFGLERPCTGWAEGLEPQECALCGDEVLAVSSRGWCDGCEEEVAGDA